MAKTKIVFGLLLCGLTVGCLCLSTEKSLTQFVPMMFGIALLILGVVALNPHWRSGSTWCAALLAAVGVVAGAGRSLVLVLQWSTGEDINELSLQSIVAMTLTCLVFIASAAIWYRRRKLRHEATLRRRAEASSRMPSEVTQSLTVAQPTTSIESPPSREPSPGPVNPYQSPRPQPISEPMSHP